MTIQEYNVLASILRGLQCVHTQGSDTIIMGKCLEALDTFLLEQQKNIREEEE